MSDFYPKRFALDFNIPAIVLEYLTPSTGQLYLHEMKLVWLNETSTIQETVDFILNAHPLYFVQDIIKTEQLEGLIQRLIDRLKYKASMNIPEIALNTTMPMK